MSQLRQGDILIYNTLDGGEISVKNGEPVMDGGMESAVYLSLFEHDGTSHWMNEYNDLPLGGKFIKFIQGKPKNVSNILKAEDLAKQDLQWMLNDGIAQKINTSIVSTTRNGILLTVEILANHDIISLNEYEINWSFQKNDPAHVRL
jgi:phage gp46-like protein